MELASSPASIADGDVALPVAREVSGIWGWCRCRSRHLSPHLQRWIFSSATRRSIIPSDIFWGCKRAGFFSSKNSNRNVKFCVLVLRWPKRAVRMCGKIVLFACIYTPIAEVVAFFWTIFRYRIFRGLFRVNQSFIPYFGLWESSECRSLHGSANLRQNRENRAVAPLKNWQKRIVNISNTIFKLVNNKHFLTSDWFLLIECAALYF